MFESLFGEDGDDPFPAGVDQTTGNSRVGLKAPPAPRNKTGLSGLSNLGATCYLNSLLQTLHFTSEFRGIDTQTHTHTYIFIVIEVNGNDNCLDWQGFQGTVNLKCDFMSISLLCSDSLFGIGEGELGQLKEEDGADNSQVS